MNVWVDADACPVAIKEILFKAARRTGVNVTLVANQPLRVPRLKQIRFLQVPSGFDVADHEIIKRIEAGDLVITNDYPLAAEVIEKGARALSPRGDPFTEDNIGERLAVRDLMDSLRSSGIATGGPKTLGKSDIQRFANQLDRLLAHGR